MQPPGANAHLILLTGPHGAGKTTLLGQLVQQAKQADWTVCGLLSPAQIHNGRKIRLHALDVYSGGRRLLASRVVGELDGPRVGDWIFDSDALAWGNALLARPPPCDLFVLDEVGPLEFDHHRGWTVAFDLLAKPMPCRLAIVVVRPDYAEGLLHRCPQAETVTAYKPAEADALARQLWEMYRNTP